MSLFGDQLHSRSEADEIAFSDALNDIASSVMGKRLVNALDSERVTQTAIEEILGYYGHKIASEDAPVQTDSIEERIEFYMRPYGIVSRKAELDRGWYRQAIGPMLGTLKTDGSAVALIPGKVSGYSYLELKTGKRVRLNRKTEKLIDSEAFCFYEPLPLKELGITDLLRFMIKQLNISDIVLYVGTLLLTSLIGLLSPMFVKWLFGDVISSGSTQMILALAGFMLSFAVCRLFISAFQAILTSRLGIKQDIAVEAAIMNRILNLPVSFFRDYASGDLGQRAAYLRAVCATMFNTVGTAGLTAVFSLIYIGQIFAFAPSLVLPSVTVTLLSFAVTLTATFRRMKITKEKLRIASENSGMTYSMISGIQKIKLAGAEKRMFARWARQYSKEAALEYDPPAFLKLADTVGLTVSLMGTLLLYWLAVKSNVSVADYYAFNAAYGMISGAFTSFAAIAISVANIKPSLLMAKPILEAKPELSENKAQIKELKGRIELSRVSFRYDETMPNVIDDLSLTIEEGEYVAVVGSSGCGKSTLMRLLLGFETPQKGSIYYDRRDISGLDMRSLRRKIGVVMQDSRLFLGSVFSNITIAAPGLTLSDAWEAARIAAIDEDIRRMPMGMRTFLSEGQGGISGGQRQRIMIARAIVSKPSVLLFDEATSALDNVTQKKISDAIDRLKCTRVVIAHRLSTIRHADRIICLRDGRIAEEGSYEELMAKNGIFAELVERQRLDTEE